MKLPIIPPRENYVNIYIYMYMYVYHLYIFMEKTENAILGS